LAVDKVTATINFLTFTAHPVYCSLLDCGVPCNDAVRISFFQLCCISQHDAAGISDSSAEYRMTNNRTKLALNFITVNDYRCYSHLI